ncbi:non-ribosomal peptide synthetase [Andreprevotia chitinilytica]|uniref:non-ribosomal peptide synthetase n=1 Tax=Andreprevotia chitinilytica TaxID=396808 RepID=UPI0024806DD8|nr:non-ribosomal peptide synthetase [Andreprevotia chitinilytica]
MSPPHVAAFLAAGGRLTNGYGPTECTTFSCTEAVSGEIDGTAIPIGKPIANAQTYILDANLEPVPVGVAGELYIAGDGLARGYLNRPDLTAEKFVPNPFGQAGARMYRSGDLARYLPDGRIDYLGRIDQQVKLRGFRIELGEIEATLMALPGVRSAVVLAREDVPGDKRLVAYVVADAGQKIEVSALREQLGQRLPDYMVPAHFMLLDQLPLTPNGKVDRKALPAPERSNDTVNFVAPRNATETQLAAIWAEVLKLDRIGIHDNFFELGGHSLLATQVSSQLRRQLGRDLPLRQFFDHPTIAALATVLDAASAQHAAAPLLPLARNNETTHTFPLSFAQQRLWFLDQFDPGSASYNIPAALHLQGALDAEALRQAFEHLIGRHEALRTHFAQQDSIPVQVVTAANRFALPLLDLTSLPTTERADAAATALRDEANRPFDLATGPLIRAGLIRLADDEHLLYYTLHHIVADGWSMGVLLDELTQLYQAQRTQQPAQLRSLPIQYADFAAWQRQWLTGAVLQDQLDYWQEALQGSPALLTLPTDRPRPTVQTYAGASHVADLPAASRIALFALSQQHGCTPFMALTAAFNVLLSRYSGQIDLCLGTPIANRNRAETEGLIGFFVNTLVLRSHIDPQASFTELLQQVRTMTLAAYDHQDLPFEQLVEALNPVRDTSYTPLFQVMLVLQNQPAPSLQLPDLNLEFVSIDATAAKFDLTLNVIEQGEHWTLQWEYNTDLFDAATIARMAGHFGVLLEGIATDPTCQVSALPWLSETESRQLLVDWNATTVAYPQDQAIHRLFEQHAAKTPDQIALVFEDQQLSYGELDARANQLAHYLRSQGVGPDVLVGLCLERSLDLVIGLLAVLKAGGAYLPLDPDYPVERLSYMLADAKPQLVLTPSAHRAVLVGHAIDLCCLDESAALFASYPTTNPDLPIQPQQLAYVIYTSGSTGRPKGVGVPHAGILNRLQWMQAEYALTAADHVLQKTPFSFDVSVWEFFWPLAYGARLVLAKPDGHKDPAYLARLIDVAAITTLHFVPPMLEVFLASADTQHCRTLRQVMCSGQALPLELQRRFHTALPGVALHNLYGPTEASVDVTYWPCQPDTPLSCVPIGRPIANIQIYLLDANLQPVPVGVTGELYIAGVGLARGYLNRPELTAETFIPNPYGEPGARMYRSGDLARYLPDGNIEYLGRIDHQVKVRGFRIELGEIETALATLPALRDAVVLARNDDGDTRLVAYLVPHAGQTLPETPALRDHLLRSLPEYMVPAHFVVLDQLPLTSNGKVDRKALPAPERNRDETAFVAPRNETEAQLAAIWAEVLKLDRVGVHDNFFELGGHSLLAVALVNRIRQAGLGTDVRAVFTHPTVAGLALALHGGSAQVTAPPNLIPAGCDAITPAMLPLVDLSADAIATIVAATPGGAANIQDIYPLAPLQEGMLFHHLLDETSDAYLAQLQFGFASRALLDGFLAALQSVIDRHDILRTAVHWRELAEPVQVVLRNAPLTVEEVKLAANAGDIAQQLSERFDPRSYRLNVSAAPMMRIFVAEDVAHGRWVAHLLQHHLIDDNLTLQLLFDEIRQIMIGQADRLPRALPFRDFIAQARLGVATAEHEAFFKTTLGHIDEPTAPFGVLDVLGDGGDVDEVRHTLPAALSQQLRQQARAYKVSTASLMHLAWGLVLARLTGRSEVVFGTVLFGRLQGGDGAERMMGPCINTLPLCLTAGAGSLRDAVSAAHAALTQLLRHEHAPLALAQRCSGVVAPMPLFSALINCRRVQSAAHAEPLAGCEIIRAEERTNLPFVLSVDDLGDDFVLTTQIGAGIPAQRIHDYVRTALESLVDGLAAQPDAPIGTLNVLPVAERNQIANWTAVTAEPAHDQALPQHFEAQAARVPERIAVVCEADTLSYSELNRRANRLAHYLRTQGVGPDVLVGLCVERSLDLLVGVLGILKAGGAYVPLDPAYPSERLAYMLADAQPRLVLTQTPLLASLPAGIATFTLDDGALGAYPDTNPAPLAGPDHLAYVIYTSGSTGKPKGALLPHRNVLRLFAATDHWFGFGERDVWTLFHSFAFDFSVWEIWGALLHGGKLVVVPQAVARDPAQCHALLQREGVTVLNQTPSAFQQLVQVDSDVAGATLPDLRYVIFGGEALNRAALAPWFVKHGDAQPALINMYGITETTVHVTYQPLAADETAAPASVGKAIPDLGAHILDAHLNPVPQGVAGELYIAGAGLARGYLNRPELTAERFVPDPFGSVPGARLYRTGDLARHLPDGNIEYLGRIDHQVKIRGFRIELGEIEAALTAQPEVREALVLVREDEPGERRLVAYLTAHADHAIPDAPALRSHLLYTLPEYMVPPHFIVLARLPLTENGKVDRKALPAPERSRDDAGYQAPRNEVETQLATLWADVLKLDRVGVHDNFFALGGHSLLAVSLIGRMRQAGFATDVRTLFAAPTVADLAGIFTDLATATDQRDASVEVPPNLIPAGSDTITPDMLTLVSLSPADIAAVVAATPGGAANIQDIYPLAPLQEGMLFHHLLAQEGDAYLVKFQFGFDRRERLDRFLAALQSVIDRHDILRTAVLSQHLDEPVQVVWRSATLQVEIVPLDPANGEITAQLNTRYDPRRMRLEISHAPLMRAFIADDAPHGRWVLHLLQHHMIDDNLTMQWLFAEIDQIMAGQADQLPRAMPFRNFIAQARLGVSMDAHEAFFSRTLGAIDAPTAPFGVIDVRGDGSAIDDAKQVLPAALSRRIRDGARTAQVSTASLMHLAWGLVLARLTGRQDVVFGTVLFGRMQGGDGADRVMGPCINTLPLCLSIADGSLLDRVRATHTALTELMRHEHAPLAVAQRASGVTPPQPLFTSLLNCRRTRTTAETPMAGIEFLGMQERTNLPFVMAVDDWAEDFLLSAQAGAGIEAQRMCDYMCTALEQLVQGLETAPHASVATLGILSVAERRQLVTDWNATATDYPRVSIQALFEQQVAAAPERVAALFGGDESRNSKSHQPFAHSAAASGLPLFEGGPRGISTPSPLEMPQKSPLAPLHEGGNGSSDVAEVGFEQALSYGELNRRANQLAHALRARGVGPDVLVGLCAERSFEALVGVLGILKAGGAYLPLDPALPAQRLAYILSDAAPALVLSHGEAWAALGLDGVPSLRLDDASLPGLPNHNPTDVTSPDHLAYVMYTSGSTGQPKGVLVTHRNVVRLVRETHYFSLDADARVLQLAPTTFDATTFELWAPLLNGAVVALPAPGRLTLAAIGEFIESQRIDTLWLTSALFNQMVDHELPRLVKARHVLAGGEALSPPHVAAFLAAGGRLTNGYGPTECTTFSCTEAVSGEIDGAAIPIGKPIANAQTYILDANLEPVPVGVAGELYIAGDGLARGYLNRPDLTAEKFVPNPYAAAGSRMYRSGDLARYLPDGRIDYLGRIDQQVKLRGFRIELGEIEATLMALPGVRDAVVLAREDEPGDKRLVAYVVADGGQEIEVSMLREQLTQRLPDYMVPAHFLVLDQLPLTPNGKVDRKALPAPERHTDEANFVAPRNTTETQLAAIWAEVLKLDRIGIHDNFFELGGHSLLATQIMSRTRRELGVDIPLNVIFETPTIAALAQRYDELQGLLLNTDVRLEDDDMEEVEY